MPESVSRVCKALAANLVRSAFLTLPSAVRLQSRARLWLNIGREILFNLRKLLN